MQIHVSARLLIIADQSTCAFYDVYTIKFPNGIEFSDLMRSQWKISENARGDKKHNEASDAIDATKKMYLI